MSKSTENPLLSTVEELVKEIRDLSGMSKALAEKHKQALLEIDRLNAKVAQLENQTYNQPGLPGS